MKILYLKDYKWLLSRERIDFLGYIRYKALTKHINFFQKNIKVKGRQCHNYEISFPLTCAALNYTNLSSILTL